MDQRLLDNLHAHEGVADNRVEALLRITRACNQKCLFCFVDLDGKSFVPMPDVLKEVETVAARFPAGDVEFVLTGGEPTVHPDFFPILEEIVARGHRARIQTNGVSFAQERNVRRVAPLLARTNLFLSFHSHLPAAYDAITGSKGQHALAVAGISALLEAKGEGIVNIVLNALNLPSLDGWVRFVGEKFSRKARVEMNLSAMGNVDKYPYAGRLRVRLSDATAAIARANLLLPAFPNLRFGEDLGGPCDLPFCVAGNLPWFPGKMFKDARHAGLDGREKLPGCASCRYEPHCVGPEKSYLARFGASEFIPVA